MKLFVVVFFGIITFKTIQNANEQTRSIGVWFLLLIQGLIFLPVSSYIFKSIKTTKGDDKRD